MDLPLRPTGGAGGRRAAAARRRSRTRPGRACPNRAEAVRPGQLSPALRRPALLHLRARPGQPLGLVRGSGDPVADGDRCRQPPGVPRTAAARRRPRPARRHAVPLGGFHLRLHRQLRRRRRPVRQRLPDPGVRGVGPGLHADRGRPAAAAERRAVRRGTAARRLPHAGPRRAALRHGAVRHPDDHDRDVDAVRLDRRKRCRRHDGRHPAARPRPRLPVPVDHPDRLRPPRRPQPRRRHRPVQHRPPARGTDGRGGAADADRARGGVQCRGPGCARRRRGRRGRRTAGGDRRHAAGKGHGRRSGRPGRHGPAAQGGDRPVRRDRLRHGVQRRRPVVRGRGPDAGRHQGGAAPARDGADGKGRRDSGRCPCPSPGGSGSAAPERRVRPG